MFVQGWWSRVANFQVLSLRRIGNMILLHRLWFDNIATIVSRSITVLLYVFWFFKCQDHPSAVICIEWHAQILSRLILKNFCRIQSGQQLHDWNKTRNLVKSFIINALQRLVHVLNARLTMLFLTAVNPELYIPLLLTAVRAHLMQRSCPHSHSQKYHWDCWQAKDFIAASEIPVGHAKGNGEIT